MVLYGIISWFYIEVFHTNVFLATQKLFLARRGAERLELRICDAEISESCIYDPEEAHSNKELASAARLKDITRPLP